MQEGEARPIAHAAKASRQSQDSILKWRWVDEKTVHVSLQLKVSQHLKGDLLKELDDECRHLSVRKTRDAFTGQDIPYG